MAERVNITTPVGRIVMGDLYKANDKDAEGKPLVVKSGPNAGQPRVNYFFALAIPKGGEPHWAHTPWGQKIWEVGCRAFPHAAQSEDFAWKIVDGDSQKPGKIFQGKPGRKPCENEGWPGHWILKLSGGFAPKVYRQENGGYVQVTDKDFVKPGYFAEVAFSVEANGSQNQPGVYLNHSMVCFRAYGQEIVFGPDVNAAGFGQAPLPAGASMTPPAGAIPMPSAPAAMPGVPGFPTAPGSVPVPGQVPSSVPAVPGMPAPGMVSAPAAVPGVPGVPGVSLPAGLPAVPGAVPVPLGQLPGGSVPMPSGPAVTAPAAIPVTPNPGFVQVPPPVAAPAPAVQGHPNNAKMTAAAGGASYEAHIAQGWTDATLVQHGRMLP